MSLLPLWQHDFFGGVTISPSDSAASSATTVQSRFASHPSCEHSPHHSTASQRSFWTEPAAQAVRGLLGFETSGGYDRRARQSITVAPRLTTAY